MATPSRPGHGGPRVRALGAVALLLASSRWALAARPPALAPELDASPDVPAFGLELRGAMRASAGAPIPIVGRRGSDCVSLVLTPLLELHNQPGADAFVPNEYWRGRIGTALSFLARRDDDFSHELSWALEHESDHSTARVDSSYGFTTLNDVSLRQRFALELGPAALEAGTELDFYFASCTRHPARCESFGGTSTLGAAVDVSLRTARGSLWHAFTPFIAVHAGGIVERREVAAEERFALHAGIASTGGSAQHIQLFGTLFSGHDPGVHRATRVVQEVGVGLRWVPR